MGRPLKIAKAQAVVNITSTTVTTNLVTTSANFTTLGIIKGMPFIPATSIGGLVAGTTYWILNVVNAGSNSTFTVSATPLNANPNSTPVSLTSVTATVATTVAPVDGYFNNPVSGAGYPATNTATYSVVGGNTAIFGSQVLANVAIGVSGNGTIYSDTGNTTIFGVGTDFANTLANGAAIQGYAANINGRPDKIDLGFVANNVGYVTVAVANTQATGNVIGTTGNAQTLYVGAPVSFDANLGGLVTGTTYFVKTIANSSAFTVSTVQYGAPKALSNATGTPNAKIDVTILTANALANTSGSNFIFATAEAGFIVRQKGKQKYLAQGATTGRQGHCYLANVANTALTPNNMTITATYANAATQTVQSLSDHTVELFTATSGPTARGNIVLENAAPAFATFNSAAVANASNAMPYPLVSIGKA